MPTIFGETILAHVAGGRLTAQDGVPIPTTGQTSATLYYEPYVSEQIALYDGAGWLLYAIGAGGVTLDVSVLTTAKNYDVFAYDNAGTVTLEASAAWTTDTARADALVRQDGVWVKSGTPTRRYLGTIRTVTSTGVKCTDTPGQRFLWNAQNRVRAPIQQTTAESAFSWTYTINAYRQANANTNNKLEVVSGLPESQADVEVNSLIVNSGSSTYAGVGVGIDSTTVNSASQVREGFGATTYLQWQRAYYLGVLTEGYHALNWLEIDTFALGVTTWFGRWGTGPIGQMGIWGWWDR